MPPTPTAALLADAARRAAAYLDGLDGRPVAPARRGRRRARGPGPARSPRGPTDPAAVLDELDGASRRPRWRWPGRASSASSSAARCPATVAANWLATAWDQNSAASGVTPGDGARSSEIALRWLARRARAPARRGRRLRHRRDASRTSPRSRRRATRCWRRRAGTSRRDGLFGAPPHHGGRRRRGARRACSRRSACSASGASAWCAVPVDGQGRHARRRAAAARRARPSSACRPAT